MKRIRNKQGGIAFLIILNNFFYPDTKLKRED
jgi:hypothetical protein